MFLAKLRTGRAVVIGEAEIDVVGVGRGHAELLVRRPNEGREVRLAAAGDPLRVPGAAVTVKWARRGEVRLAIDAPPEIRIRVTKAGEDRLVARTRGETFDCSKCRHAGQLRACHPDCPHPPS